MRKSIASMPVWAFVATVAWIIGIQVQLPAFSALRSTGRRALEPTTWITMRFVEAPLLLGLAVRGFFDALSGQAPAAFDHWTMLAFVIAAALSRVGVLGGAVWLWATYWLTVEALLRNAQQEAGSGASGGTVGPGNGHGNGNGKGKGKGPKD